MSWTLLNVPLGGRTAPDGEPYCVRERDCKLLSTFHFMNESQKSRKKARNLPTGNVMAQMKVGICVCFPKRKLCVVSGKLLVNDNYDFKSAEMKAYLSCSLPVIILPLPEGLGDLPLMSKQKKWLPYVPYACCGIQALHILPHLTLSITPRDRYFYSHFMDKKNINQGGCQIYQNLRFWEMLVLRFYFF